MTSNTDWHSWHDRYSDPASSLAQRLRTVQRRLSEWLDSTSPRPVTVLSSCSGDGRDLLGVLEGRGDASRVAATLIDADAANCERAREVGHRLSIGRFEVRCADAGTTDAYVGAVPADLVMLCGIFGNLDDYDVARTIAATPQLCGRDATVIWTRSRETTGPDPTTTTRDRLRDRGFAEVHLDASDHSIYTVGVHRFGGTPETLVPGRRLFTFIT